MLRALWRDLCYALKTQNQLAVVGATNWYPSGMAVVSRSGLLIVLCFFVRGDPCFFLTKWIGRSIKDTDCDCSGSFAATCKYECEQTGGCTAKYSGPPRSGNTIVRVPSVFAVLTSCLITHKWHQRANHFLLELWQFLHTCNLVSSLRAETPEQISHHSDSC